MIRSIAFVCAVLCASCLSNAVRAGAPAATLNIDLDLQFNDPFDTGSGGDWTISALASDFGLAGLVAQLDSVNETVTFLISNSVFEVQFSGFLGGTMILDVTAGDNLATPTYNVGVGSPVDIATGTFNPGDFPAFVAADGTIFSAPNGVGLSIPIVTTTITTNIVPEPATLTLFGLGLLGLTTMARRRS